MKRIIIACGIAGIAIFILYQFLFADRRSRLKVDPSKILAASFNETINIAGADARYLVKESRLSFEVANVVNTRDSIQLLVGEFDGYIASESQDDNAGISRIIQTVHVPVDVIEDFTRKVSRLSMKLETSSVAVRDVTEEYIDVDSRIATKKRMEARFEEIIKKANTIAEIMDIERQIGTVRSEIEAMEARRDVLAKQTSYGTVYLAFHEKAPAAPVAQTGVGYELLDALKNGWMGLLTVVVAIVLVWPLWIVMGITVFLYFRFRRFTTNPS